MTKHQERLGEDNFLVDNVLITSENYTSTTLAAVDSQENKDACKEIWKILLLSVHYRELTRVGT